MTTSLEAAPLIALHQLSLYNTGRMPPEQLIAAFAARLQQFERIVGDVAAEKPKSRAQHHLIVGQRGMGKTMLLARIAAELHTDAALAARFIPLVFAEEQYAVDRLSKFWLNCLDSLADARELASDTTGVDEIDDTVRRLTAAGMRAAKDDQPFAAEVYEAFAGIVKRSGQRPVLLVDNLQLVFERLDDGQQHSLRELLMRPGSPILIGATPSLPSDDYAAAFYDQFKVHYLRPLDESEMRALLVHLADVAKRDDVRQRVLQHPARLTVLRQLTGGNPRTALTLFFLYAEDFAPNVFGDLEGLLDRVTPLYKARFEELTPQQQVIASAVANHWDPLTAAKLATITGLPPGTISAQLDRLEKTGVVERTELFGETSTGYQLAERFFNIWFLMRSASRRQRRQVEFLTRFLENFYEPADRSRLARHLMEEDRFSADRYMLSRALADSLIDPADAEELRRHAELTALREEAAEARAKLRELIDFRTLPAETLAFDDLRKKLISAVPADARITPEAFAKAVLGDRRMFMSREREVLARRAGKLSTEEIQTVLNTVRTARSEDEARYSADAVEWFSQRLASGQIRSARDADDWNRAFLQAGDECMELMVKTLPVGFGSALTEAAFSRIASVIEPEENAGEFEWWLCAWLLERMGRVAHAETAYRGAIAIDPENGWDWYFLGSLLARDDSRFAEAEEAFRRAILHDPENVAPLRGLAGLLTHRERYDEAETTYRAAINLNPNDALVWHGLANLLKEVHRYGEAELAYRQAVTAEPKSAWAWKGLGDLLQYRSTRYEEAEAAYREAIAADPTFESAWISVGNLLRDHLQRYSEAATAYREALAFNPKRVSAWKDLLTLFSNHLNSPAEAADVCDNLLRLDPTNERALQEKIFIRRDSMGESSRASQLMEELRALSGGTLADTTHLQKALFATYDANWGLAREALAAALAVSPDGFSAGTVNDWLRASAVFLHLNYGAELLAFLKERGDTARLRPWVEALRAHQAGDRLALQNIAPEIRTAAESFYDRIDSRLKQLPEKTRRRPVVKAKPTRTRRRPRGL